MHVTAVQVILRHFSGCAFCHLVVDAHIASSGSKHSADSPAAFPSVGKHAKFILPQAQLDALNKKMKER
jgi:hypothetical protein